MIGRSFALVAFILAGILLALPIIMAYAAPNNTKVTAKAWDKNAKKIEITVEDPDKIGFVIVTTGSGAVKHNYIEADEGKASKKVTRDVMNVNEADFDLKVTIGDHQNPMAIEFYRVAKSGAVVKWLTNIPAAGGRYYANIQLKDGADILPPGAAAHTQRIEVDSGSPFTIVDRVTAKQLGLLKADGTDNNFAIGQSVVGGVAGGTLTVWVSKPLTSIKAKCKKADGTTDFDQEWLELSNKTVLYPVNGQPDLHNLLGTNFIDQMTDTGLTMQAKRCSFFDKFPKPGDGKKVTTEDEPKDPGTGGHKRKQIKGNKINHTTVDDPFIIATGVPYTIIGAQLAAELGLTPEADVPLYDLEPETYNTLFIDEFVDSSDPGPFPLAIVDSFEIPASPDNVIHRRIPVFINPISDENILGTNLLEPGGVSTKLFYPYDEIWFIVIPITGANTYWSTGAGLLTLAGGLILVVLRRRRRENTTL